MCTQELQVALLCNTGADAQHECMSQAHHTDLQMKWQAASAEHMKSALGDLRTSFLPCKWKQQSFGIQL
jgi:hypothetical protein